MNAVVYLITFDNGKRYVGQTVRLKRRIHAHLRDRTALVSRATRAHAWHVEVLAESDDPNEIDLIERAAISAFNTLVPGGYNLQTGGKEGNCSEAVAESNRRRAGLPRKMTAEGRAAKIAALTAPEVVARRAATHVGVRRSAEARARMSEAAKRRCTPEWCEAQSVLAKQTCLRDPETGQILGRMKRVA